MSVIIPLKDTFSQKTNDRFFRIVINSLSMNKLVLHFNSYTYEYLLENKSKIESCKRYSSKKNQRQRENHILWKVQVPSPFFNHFLYKGCFSYYVNVPERNKFLSFRCTQMRVLRSLRYTMMKETIYMWKWQMKRFVLWLQTLLSCLNRFAWCALPIFSFFVSSFSINNVLDTKPSFLNKRKWH